VQRAIDILYLSGLFPPELEEEIIRLSVKYVQNAANVLQQEILSGLESHCPEKVTVLNSPFIGAWPFRYKTPFIKSSTFSHNSKTLNTNVGYLNVFGVSKLSQYYVLKRHVKSWVRKPSLNPKVVIAYAATTVFTKLLTYIKQLDSEIATILIVPDLPEYWDTTGKKKFYQKLIDLEVEKIYDRIKNIDGFVLLTEHMSNRLNIQVPYTVVEGIAPSKPLTQTKVLNSDNEIRTVLYSGTLSKKYGIVDLIEAFLKLPNECYRFVVCGSGEMADYIVQASRNDNRIVFNGLIPRDEVLQLQKSATVLVNPRNNNERYTKFSFPSKIMEYLASGTPVIAYHLDGMPADYRKYMYTINEDDKNALFNTLSTVLEKSNEELRLKGEIAQKYVLAEKTATKQVHKIIKLMNEIL